jgi:hypothetical protein
LAQHSSGAFNEVCVKKYVNAGSQECTITYSGGASGHDVVLTRVVHNIVSEVGPLLSAIPTKSRSRPGELDGFCDEQRGRFRAEG